MKEGGVEKDNGRDGGREILEKEKCWVEEKGRKKTKQLIWRRERGRTKGGRKEKY